MLSTFGVKLSKVLVKEIMMRAFEVTGEGWETENA
jgi:hypothetical protein